MTARIAQLLAALRDLQAEERRAKKAGDAISMSLAKAEARSRAHSLWLAGYRVSCIHCAADYAPSVAAIVRRHCLCPACDRAYQKLHRDGQIAPIAPAMERFQANISVQPNGCHLWTASRDRAGYGRFVDGGVHHKAHRWIFEQVKGPIPAGLGVLHNCDTPPCVNSDHLRAGTQADNAADMVVRRRGTLRLTEEQDAEIRAAYRYRSPDNNFFALADKYGVSATTIMNVVRGRQYRSWLAGWEPEEEAA
jgi:hypothetical protein